MIQLVCFDVDDTLLDFHKGEEVAFLETMHHFDLACTIDDYHCYEKINEGMWKAYEKGNITKERLRIQRFEEYMNEKGIVRDAVEMAEIYQYHLSQQCFVLEHSFEVVKACAEKVKLAIATNGIAMVQRSRLKKSGLLSYFDYLFISEEMNCVKPQKEYFEKICEEANCSCENILFVGDSLSADIVGAVQSGCVSVWFNPKHLENQTGVISDYEIDDLRDVMEILKENL